MSNIDFNNTKTAFAYRKNFDLIKAYNMFYLMKYNWLVKIGTGVTMRALDTGIVAPFSIAMKPTVYRLFCGGPTLEKSVKKIEKLYNYGVQSILDYGVEAQADDNGFDQTAAEIKKAIRFANAQQSVPIVVSKFTGLVRFSILEKLHAGESLSSEEQSSFDQSLKRIDELCALAHEHKVGLFIDAEESWIQQPLDEITENLMAKYNRDYPVVYNTVQLYLKSRLGYLKEAHARAKAGGYYFGAKLVRGAYMEKEAKRAKKLKYENPVQDSKAETDKDYDAAVAYCLAHFDDMAVCVATHNETSCAKAVSIVQDRGIAPNNPRIFFSQLLGMSDHISFNMAAEGFNVAKYMPYGPVREVIPYLVRRAQENTSVSGQMGRELSLLKNEMKRRKLIW